MGVGRCSPDVCLNPHLSPAPPPPPPASFSFMDTAMKVELIGPSDLPTGQGRTGQRLFPDGSLEHPRNANIFPYFSWFGWVPIHANKKIQVWLGSDSPGSGGAAVRGNLPHRTAAQIRYGRLCFPLKVNLFMLVLRRECGNEPRDALKGNHKGRTCRDHFLIPCWAPGFHIPSFFRRGRRMLRGATPIWGQCRCESGRKRQAFWGSRFLGPSNGKCATEDLRKGKRQRWEA